MNGYSVKQQSNSHSDYATPEPAKEESPLARDLRCITDAIARLDNELIYLRDKLLPVTLAEEVLTQEKGCGSSPPIPNRSTYGYNLRDHERQLHAMADAVNSLRNRLEV
jgi:hypothetical protein